MKTLICLFLAIVPEATAIFRGYQPGASSSPDTIISEQVNAEGASITYPHATPGHGDDCAPGGLGCLLRHQPGSAGEYQLTYFTPVSTGLGHTGIQMCVEFSNEFPGLTDGILGTEEEGNEATIPVHASTAAALHCRSIEVVNKVYYPVYDAAHPFGYIILDCYVMPD